MGGIHPAFSSRIEVFGHPGISGAIAFADPEYRFSLAILKNYCEWNPSDYSTETKIARLIRAELQIPE
ncbi:hypothetical protein MK805_11290 [Shimazuella sp. AN120528]|uniref:hypothetical protein n=1 Tax=Shimazuella soli TaxID=1892854 RepID=UPI001F0CEE2B|nr:hypothetical protein [Shimazuella soli]MCH5585534.1 hypothetical protein [Shimazuella soli]